MPFVNMFDDTLNNFLLFKKNQLHLSIFGHEVFYGNLKQNINKISKISRTQLEAAPFLFPEIWI